VHGVMNPRLQVLDFSQDAETGSRANHVSAIHAKYRTAWVLPRATEDLSKNQHILRRSLKLAPGPTKRWNAGQ
jgi:hypothetical protein